VKIEIISYMMLNRRIGICFFLLTALAGCNAQSQEDKILEVSRNDVHAIANNNPTMFMSILDKDLAVYLKTPEMVTSDVDKFNKLFAAYLKDKEPGVELTELYNFLGQRLVRIPIYDNEKDTKQTDSLYLPNAKKVTIDLYFGPPDIKPLNRLSGYELVINDENIDRFQPYEHWRR